MEALVHDKPHKCRTYAEHCTKAFVLGTSTKHYRCWKFWTPTTRATRISGAAFFKHKYLTNPSITPEDQVIAAAAHLSNTLQGIRSPQLHTSTLKSLGDLQDIFHEAANRTPDHSPMQAPRTLPRVTPTPTPAINGHIAHNETSARTQELRVPLHTRRILPTPIPITKPPRRSQRIADLGILSPNTPPVDTPAHNTRSRIRERTITQEAILACMNTYNYITSRSLTPANASRRSFPPKILNAVLDMDTGELLEMRHLLVNPKYKDVWGKSYTTELGCLAQDIPRISEGTNTIVFIRNSNGPTQERHIWTHLRKLSSQKG